MFLWVAFTCVLVGHSSVSSGLSPGSSGTIVCRSAPGSDYQFPPGWMPSPLRREFLSRMPSLKSPFTQMLPTGMPSSFLASGPTRSVLGTTIDWSWRLSSSLYRPSSLLLRQQAGGSSFLFPLSESRGDTYAVSLPWDCLSARHIPGKLNIVADSLSRAHSVLHTKWTLQSGSSSGVTYVFYSHGGLVFNSIQPQAADLCVSGEESCSVGDRCPWSRPQTYAFPPLPILVRVTRKARIRSV